MRRPWPADCSFAGQPGDVLINGQRIYHCTPPELPRNVNFLPSVLTPPGRPPAAACQVGSVWRILVASRCVLAGSRVGVGLVRLGLGSDFYFGRSSSCHGRGCIAAPPDLWRSRRVRKGTAASEILTNPRGTIRHEQLHERLRTSHLRRDLPKFSDGTYFSKGPPPHAPLTSSVLKAQHLLKCRE